MATKIEADISNSNSKSTKLQEQQIIVNHALTLGPLCAVFEFGRPELPTQHSATISVHPSRGGRP